MRNKTITFKCDTCGQELTFYKDSFGWDGCSCPICDPLGYKPMLKPTNIKVLFGKREVLKTRELYRKACKSSPKMSLEEALNN